MNIYEVQPIFSHPTHPFELTIDAPGSKSITNRALMLAALANGETLLKGALFSDDSRHFLQCLKDLGFDVVVDEPAHTVRITGLGGRIPKETAAINVGSAGTAARFLTAMLGCAKGVWHLDASEQMKKRPMAALLNTLTDLGCRIDCHEKEGYFPFTIYSEGITAYQSQDYQIEPDVSAAAYFYGMAVLSGGNVLVRHVHFDSLQGDVALLRTFEKMGCSAEDTPEGIRLTGPAQGRLHGIDIDMSSFSDQALTMAAIAPFADSPTFIRGIGHIRLQESDRMAAIVENLSRMGIHAAIEGNDIYIEPGTPHVATIETYDDHRVAMAFSLTGLRTPGIIISNPLCCRKTFENYFDVLDAICRNYLK